MGRIANNAGKRLTEEFIGRLGTLGLSDLEGCSPYGIAPGKAFHRFSDKSVLVAHLPGSLTMVFSRGTTSTMYAATPIYAKLETSVI